MKLETQMSFPYPLLASWTDDYIGAAFDCDITPEEYKDFSGIRLTYKFNLTENNIAALIFSGKAKWGLIVHCGDTFFERLLLCESETGTFEFSGGKLRGKVEVLPVICAVDSIEDYSSPKLNEEYSGSVFSLRPGNIIAAQEKVTFYAGHEKLAPLETIFILSKFESMEDHEINVDCSGDKINITCSEKTLVQIQNFRGSKPGKVLLFNGVYLPALIQVLVLMAEGGEGLESNTWFRVINAKCISKGMELNTENVLETAQKLLERPLAKLAQLESVTQA